MRKLTLFVLALPVAVFAQDAARPFNWGGFENSGSATFGYRFTEVKGYQPSFDQMFDMKSGPRLLDFSLFGKAADGSNRFADDYSITATGIGGDPFTTTQFTVRKAHVYDLRVNFRQSRYYFNQNDSALLPSGLSGLTNNHDWATVTKNGTIDLTIHATENLRFALEYSRNSRSGTTFTTESLAYFGSSSTWGSFARADPYYLIAPINDDSNRIAGGFDYTHGGWTLHYIVGYQTFTENITGANVVAGEVSINVNDPTTANEPLNNASWTDYRKLTTPVSEFSYTDKITKALEAHGSYLFYRYTGPASLNLSANGIARTNTAGTADAPYGFSESDRAIDSEPDNIVTQGFSYRVNDWFDVMTDYRYARTSLNSSGVFSSYNAGVVSNGTALDQWRIGTSTLDFDAAFTPFSSFSVRVGVRLMKSDVLALDNGVADPISTKRTKTIWPILSSYYQPSKKLSVRGDIDQTTNNISYTALTPHTDVGGRLTVRYRPFDKVYIEDSLIVRNRTLLTTDYHSNVRANSGTINYDIHPKASLYAGFSYDSMYMTDFVSFLRGTAPLTDTIVDQEVDRVWTGGLRLENIKRFGFNFSGNFVRTTGLAQITGELPNYGPQSFPYASGSLFYDFPRWGRMTIKLQRTYLLEQIVTGNNFSANMLTIAWTRAF